VGVLTESFMCILKVGRQMHYYFTTNSEDEGCGLPWSPRLLHPYSLRNKPEHCSSAAALLQMQLAGRHKSLAYR